MKCNLCEEEGIGLSKDLGWRSNKVYCLCSRHLLVVYDKLIEMVASGKIKIDDKGKYNNLDRLYSEFCNIIDLYPCSLIE
jgi:hypothetical protein